MGNSRENDRWSGHVAFPGGRCSGNESSYETAIRETEEEIGLHLASEDFYFCGSSTKATVKIKTSFKVAVFVFYQCCENTPKLTLEKKEVNSVRWIDLEILMNPNQKQDVKWPMNINNFVWYYRILFRIFNIKNLYFPGILLPETNEEFDNIEDEYHLWGMTLGCTQKLLENGIIEYEKLNAKGNIQFNYRIPLPFTTGNVYIDSVTSILQSLSQKKTRSRL